MNELKGQLGDWINMEEAGKFLNYKKTQLGKLLRENPIIKTSRINRRRFISKSSLIKFLDDNAAR